MANLKWEKLMNAIDKALDLDAADRIAFINKEYENESLLRKEAIKFLESVENSKGFWENMLESGSVLVDELTLTGVFQDESELFSPLKQAGPYKIIKLIARGGMGNVYLAERSDGQFNRRAAIKILRRELISEHHTKLFLAEREILSGLEHPNIARLYDAGVADGRPYLVMEYVDGEPITHYCSNNNCTFETKMELFKQVCKAVKFAHRNLTIHRDLKPDNIFVTKEGIVKILDFGIAKVINTDLIQENKGKDEVGPRLFSLQYAAPEQITQGQITTSTDIYSLGLLLYELLTDSKPFDLPGKKLREAEDAILTEIPKKPSRKVSRSKLSRKLKGELDAIILNALQKEPDLRYSTVDQFIEDIGRSQMNLPIHARESSVSYLFSKFIRRNRALFSALIIAVCLVFGFITYHLSEVQKQKEIALAGQQQAEFVTGYLTDLFLSASPNANQGDTLSVFNMLDLGKDGLSALDDNFRAKPKLLTAFADSYLNLGNYEEAISKYEQAYEITQSTHGISEQLANGAIRLGNAHSANRKFDTAIFYYEEVLEMIDTLEGDFSHLKAGFLGRYAIAVLEVGDIERSFQILEEARNLHAELNLTSGIFSDLNEMRNLAIAYRHNEQYEESEKLYREILQINGQEIDLNGIYNDLAYLLKVQERPVEAIYYYSKSLAGLRTNYGEDHPNTLLVMGNLAGAYSYDEQYEKAEAILLQTIPLIKQRYGEYHWRVGSAKEGLGRFYLEMNNFERAEELFFEASSIYNEVLRSGHNWTTVTTIYLAYCKAVNGFTEESDILFRDAYATLRLNRDDFDYFEETRFENLLTNLNTHHLEIWHEEIALLEEIK